MDTRKLSAHVKRLRPTTDRPDYAIEVAITHLREAATCLRAAGAPKALHRVQLALTSARGALRNSGRRMRQENTGQRDLWIEERGRPAP